MRIWISRRYSPGRTTDRESEGFAAGFLRVSSAHPGVHSLHLPMANHIHVERERLCSPLRDLKNLKPAMLKQFGRCTLSVAGGSLSIITPMLSIHLPATGEWDEDVSVKLADLVAAESAIAQIPTVSIAVEGDSLLIGGVEVDFEPAE